MPEPGVNIETVHNPGLYSIEQLDRACQIAYELERGKLVLAEPPERADPRAD